jgi:hypothetical protein
VSDLVLPSLAEALEVALRDAEPRGATVHVFSSPEGDCGDGEVVCSPQLRPVVRHAVPSRRCSRACRLCARFVVYRRSRVVYHPEVVMLVGGGWACTVCGHEGGTRGRAPARPALVS